MNFAYIIVVKTRPAEDVLITPSHLSKKATPNGQRKEKLRTDCLRRNRYRCVVTHRFHRSEAYRRPRESGLLKIAPDDEGKVIDIRQPGIECYDLEVAHIVPFCILHPPSPPGRKTRSWLVLHFPICLFREPSLTISRIILKYLQLRY